MKRISIVVPAFNEAASIPHLFERLAAVAVAESQYEFEMLFVDDGSSDGTLGLLRALSARDPRVRFISLSRNFGHQAALSAGLDAAGGDALVFLDADLQHPPELIPTMLRAWEGGMEIVNTVRRSDRELSIFKRVTSAGFYRLVNLLAEVRVQPNGADFRLLDRRAADALKQVGERARFLRGLVQWIGFHQTTVEYHPDKRFAGSTKFSARKMLRLAFDGIFSFSTVPLQLATWLGLCTSGAAFVYALYALYIKLFAGLAIPGWTSLLVVVLLLGGVQLVTLGILGSYIARIYNEVRSRPLYLVREESSRQMLSSSSQPTLSPPPPKPIV